MSTDLIIGLVAIAFVAIVIILGNSRRAAKEREAREAQAPLSLGNSDGGGKKRGRSS